MRTLLKLALAFMLACAAATAAIAQASFPTKPVRLIIPFPPGGGTDILARPLAQKLSEIWGQPVVIDNKGGAGGNIGTELAARAPADGYTLVLGTVGTHAINRSLYANPTFDPVRDFAAITIVANQPNILVVHPSVKARSVRELVALAKAAPGQLNYSSPGNGTPPHLAMEIFKKMAGVDITHVPYKGSGSALSDLLSGRIQMMIGGAPVVLPYVSSGKLVALASTSAQRPAMFSDIATIAESGYPGYEMDTWYGMFTAANTPRGIVEKLNADLVKALHTPEIAQVFEKQGAEVIGSSSAQASSKVKSDGIKWQGVIGSLGMKVD